MKYLYKLLAVIFIFVICIISYYNYQNRITLTGHRVVLCIPVYGQSLALGEEAERITDFDTLRIKYNGRIVTECLDYGFGYCEGTILKQRIKKFVRYKKRVYELSLYKMAEELSDKLGEDTVICILPGGLAASPIDSMNKGKDAYNKFLYEINLAYKKTRDRGWKFYIPAICWMQGETDITDIQPGDNYKQKLKKFCTDINKDIKGITHQNEDVYMIVYQANALTNAERFNANEFNSQETTIPQAFVDLINKDSLFWASGPTYPYHCVNEIVHIDGVGQQHIGKLEAETALRIIRGGDKSYGLTPDYLTIEDNDVIVTFHVPQPPLVFDTIAINPAKNYGFSVITEDGKDIVSHVSIEDNSVRVKCNQSPTNCKIRYAVNGDYMKSGREHGPRGNLRDSQGEKETIFIQDKKYPVHNWCYQFDLLCK